MKLRYWVPLLLLAAACADEGASVACLSLEEVRRVGHAQLDTAGLDARAIAAQGGVLGNVRGVVPAADGSLYVLDRGLHKIVVFREDGSVARVILGGEGDGPGQFRLPMNIAATPTGVAVVDFEQKRITEFDSAGAVQRVTQLDTPQPWRLTVRGDTAWVSYSPSGGASSLASYHRVLLGSGARTAGQPLLPEDQAYGLGLGVAARGDGAILVNTARPGVWMVAQGESWTRQGTPLFPADGAPTLQETRPGLTRVNPAQYTAGGLGVIGDSLVVQGFLALPRPFNVDNPPARHELAYSVALFGTDGQPRGIIRLPMGVTGAYLHADNRTGRIFLTASEPFPQAVEYRVVPCSNE